MTYRFPRSGLARCDVKFAQPVNSCVPVVSVRRKTDGSPTNVLLAPATNQDHTPTSSYAGLDNDEVAVMHHDTAGVLTTTARPAFYIAVFC